MKGSKYLSELVDCSMFQKGKLNLIEAPTGCGKTYFALKHIPSLVKNPLYKVAFLIDTTNGKEQIMRKYHSAPATLDWQKSVETEMINFADEQHKIYETRYGHNNPNSIVEIVNLHIAGEASIGRATIKKVVKGTGAAQADRDSRDVIFHGKHYDTAIYHRENLGAGDKVFGPAIISEYDSTTILWPGDEMQVDEYGNMVIRFNE